MGGDAVVGKGGHLSGGGKGAGGRSSGQGWN